MSTPGGYRGGEFSDPRPPENPQEVSRDARERAVRSFLWGLLVDLGAAVVVVLMTSFTVIEWTKEYWAALGLMLAKSVLQAVVAFFARKLMPPNPKT